MEEYFCLFLVYRALSPYVHTCLVFRLYLYGSFAIIPGSTHTLKKCAEAVENSFTNKWPLVCICYLSKMMPRIIWELCDL